MSSSLRFAALVALGLTVAAPADAQRRRAGAERPNAKAQERQPDGRRPAPNDDGQGDGAPSPCPNDQFFVHVPTFASASTVPADFANRVRNALRGHISANGALAGTTVTVQAVLDPRPAVTQRADGHLRFWSITTNKGIPPGSLCGWLDALRGVAQGAVGADLYVGRECLASGLADPGAPDWPLEVMGKPAAPRGTPAPIAIIDSGFKASPDWVAPGVSGALHPHGAMIEGVVQQITASARTPSLLDYRVMGSDGTAPLADVARAIDAAVFDARGARVINLSLGWPPELERRRTIAGCATVEDPVGEAVRYTLAMAHLRDAGQLTGEGNVEGLEGATPVIIAAGNRAALFGDDVTPYFAAHYGVDFGRLAGDCSQPSGDGFFYPAHWARRRTCLKVGAAPIRVAGRFTAVGATDHRDQRSPLTTPEMTPLLVAPGVGIRIGGDRWSGSSLAAAYVSAAVSLQLAGGGDGRAAVQAVSGRATALPHLRTRVPPRRLTFATAHTAGAPIYRAGGAKVNGAGVTSITGRDRGRCLRVLKRWIKGTASRAQLVGACPAFMADLDAFSAGDAGPQPPTSGCPECFFDVRVADEEGDLHVALTDEWDPASTTISDPHLVVAWPDGYEEWIPLPGGTKWAPKQAFTVEDLKLKHPLGKSTVSDLVASGSMTVTMTVVQSGKKSVDVSVVILKP